MAFCDRCGGPTRRQHSTICYSCEGELNREKSLAPKQIFPITTKKFARAARRGQRPVFNASIDLAAGQLGFSSGIVAGAMAQRLLEKREQFKAMQGTPKVLVKNGKPTCAEGAKLLGVPWIEPEQ